MSTCFPVSAGALSVGLAVGLTLLVGVIVSILLFLLNRRCYSMYGKTYLWNLKRQFIWFIKLYTYTYIYKSQEIKNNKHSTEPAVKGFLLLCFRNQPTIMTDEATEEDSGFDMVKTMWCKNHNTAL